MPTRNEVYRAIDTEREYQDRLWNENTTTSEGLHSVTEFLVYIDDYLREAKTQVSRGADPKASQDALNTVRKLAALCVVCMEQNGAPERQAPVVSSIGGLGR